jgi:hypothetical protein
VVDCFERDSERRPQRTVGGAAAQTAQRSGQIAADRFNAAAEPLGEAGGEPAAVEATRGESEFVELRARQSGRHDDEGGHGTAPSGSIGRRRRAVAFVM